MELPAGFRFEPTDEELILSCLYSKISGQPLDTDAVATVNVYTTEPWNLLPEDVAESYFFTPMARKYNRGARPDRTAGRGTWIAYKVESVISCDGDVVGRKRCLAFGMAEKQNTGWTMYEYELAFGSSSRETQFHEWVLCLIKRPPPRCVTNGAVCSRRRKRKRDSERPMPDDATILSVDCGGGGGGGSITSAIAGVVDPFTHKMIIQEKEVVDPFARDDDNQAQAAVNQSAEDGTVMINSVGTGWSNCTSVLPAESPMPDDATIILSSGSRKEEEYGDVETAIADPFTLEMMMPEEELVDPFAWDQAAVTVPMADDATILTGDVGPFIQLMMMQEEEVVVDPFSSWDQAAVTTPSAEDGTVMIKSADTATGSCASFLPAESRPLMPVVDDATILSVKEEDQYSWDLDLIGLELSRPVPASSSYSWEDLFESDASRLIGWSMGDDQPNIPIPAIEGANNWPQFALLEAEEDPRRPMFFWPQLALLETETDHPSQF